MSVAIETLPPIERIKMLVPPEWKMPSPQRRRIEPPPFEHGVPAEYVPEINLVVPKGWRPPPPGEKCVCDRCIRLVCNCIEVHDNPTPFQIECCYIHGQRTLVGDLYRAIHLVHNDEIAKEISSGEESQ